MLERLKMIMKMGLFDENIIIVTKKGVFCEGEIGMLFVKLYGMLISEIGESKLEQLIINYKNIARRKYEDFGKTTDSEEKE